MNYSKGRRIYIAVSTVILLAVLVTIFILSAQDGEESSSTSGFITDLITAIFGQDASEDIIRTLAHFCEFACLGFLMCNFIFSLKDSLKPFFSILFSFIYAVSDEIHQYFVPERACQLSDLAVDTGGLILGTLAFCILIIIKNKLQRKKLKA